MPSANRPGRVLQVLPTLQRRGMEKVVCDIALALNGDVYEIEVCSLSRKGPFEEVLTGQGIGVYCLDETGPRDMAAAGRFLSILRRGRYDIVHLHCAPASSYQIPILWLAQVPGVICTFHMTPGLPAPPGVRAKTAVCRLLARLLSHRVDWAYACSGAVLAAHRQDGWRHCPSSVIYNGIDMKLLCPAADRAPARAELGIRADDIVIGSVGSLCPQKGQSCLIQALPRIRSRRPNARLLFVGSGPDAATLARMAKQMGCGGAVQFIGEGGHVAQYLHAMDVFAFPSIAEGFGLALAEAMACGVPVVASAVGGVPELVSDGVSGLLVPPQDPEALAAAILSILESPDLAAGLSTTARRVIANNFTVGGMTTRVSELYARLLQRQPQASIA